MADAVRREKLIDLIYSAGVDPSKWQTVLAELAVDLDAACGALHAGNIDGSGFGFGATHNLNPEAVSAYADHLYAINPLNAPLNRVKAGAVVGHHQLVPVEEYRQSAFYHEYCERFALEGSATAVLAKNNDQNACLGIVQELASDPFTPQQISFLQSLLPHLQRSLDLNMTLSRVKAERDMAHEALNALETAIFFLSEGGLVISANAAGEALVRTGDGLRLRQGRLLSTTQVTTNKLSALIAQAVAGTDDRGGAIALPRSSGKRSLMCKVMPFQEEGSWLGSKRAAAVVFVRDPDLHPHERIDEVLSAYGLTAAEGRLVRALSTGLSVQEYADAQGITTTTARNQLAQALRKTDTNRQAELLRVILESRIPVR